MHSAKFGTPVSIAPFHTNCSASSTGVPSTVRTIPPKGSSRRPVAVTTRSASRTRPPLSRTPSGTNVSIVPVTTSARPRFSALNRSASGTAHNRWSQGS